MLPTTHIHLYLAILRAIKVPTMPSTFSNDLDFVRPTQYVVPPGKKAKTPAPKPWKLPPFNALHINDFHLSSASNLPLGIDNSDPLALFRLFFTDKIVENIAEWTNAYAA